MDRALTSSSWLSMFFIAKLYNLEGSSSYHSLILLVPREAAQQVGPIRLKFENAWLSKPMCRQLVKDGWEGNEHNIFSIR